MIELLVGALVILTPYIVGAIFTRIADGYWFCNDIQDTFLVGVVLTAMLAVILTVAYAVGYLVMLPF